MFNFYCSTFTLTSDNCDERALFFSGRSKMIIDDDDDDVIIIR